MKKTLAVLLIIVTLFSCEKNKIEPPSHISEPLIGKWELIELYGGWSGRMTPENLGHTPYIRFFKNKKYRRYEDDKLIRSNRYEFVEMDKDSNGVVSYAIKFKGEGDLLHFFKVENDTLYLKMHAVDDGVDQTFIRAN